MPSKEEKERRKLIAEEMRLKANQEFESNLPMSREHFEKLFDYLDEKLSNVQCEDDLKFTTDYLMSSNIEDINSVKKWLGEHSGYCDCEVLANVEEMFE